jgi:hypothetical protein
MKKTGLGTLKIEHQVLKEYGDTQSTQKQVHPRGLPKRPIGKAFHSHAQDTGDGHGADNHQGNHKGCDHDRLIVAGQEVKDPPSRKPADHIDLTMGEVEHEQDSVHHGVPDGNEGIDPA